MLQTVGGVGGELLHMLLDLPGSLQKCTCAENSVQRDCRSCASMYSKLHVKQAHLLGRLLAYLLTAYSLLLLLLLLRLLEQCAHCWMFGFLYVVIIA
jgi:hypothetical protein